MMVINERPAQRPLDPSIYDAGSNENENDGIGGYQKKKGKKSSGGFQSLGLSEDVYRGIVKMGFRVPTPVQRKALPICLSGVDTVVMARTGSGKTAAFILPILEKLVSKQSQNSSIMGSYMTSTVGVEQASGSSINAVILSPTRELALQTLKVFKTLSFHCQDITATAIIGADSIEKQFAALAAKPDVLVATPGRLAHLLAEIPDFHLKACEILVLDEADRLFEMGFAHQIREICRTLPKEEHACQKMLFSATMPKGLVEFTREGTGVGLLDPVVIRLDNEVQVSDELRIGFVTCRTEDKDAVLLFLVRDILLTKNVLKSENKEETENALENEQMGKKKKKKKKEKNDNGVKKHEHLTLIFCATRHHVEYVTSLLKAALIPATMIYGSMDLEARKSSLHAFRSGQSPVLVVTDVAARGIDIPLIENVIHHSFPPSAKLFVHRSGRAARAGRIGYCFGLVDPEEMPYMVDLHVFLGYKLSSGNDQKELTDGANVEEDTSNDNQISSSYTLDEMSPEMVHYGSVPEWILTEQVEELHRLIRKGENTTSMKRVCNNAMKQYRRSRPDASRAGIRKAKDLLANNRSQDYHPLLRKIEEDWLAKEGKNKADDLKKRQEFLRAMANFRPKETIFEAFATGTGSGGMMSSQVDKGQTVGKDNAAFNANSLKAMKSMRRQMRLVRNKETSLVVAGSTNAKLLNGDELDDQMEGDNEQVVTEVKLLTKSSLPSNSAQSVQAPKVIQSKQRMSKAQRRQMKKNKNQPVSAKNNNIESLENKKSKKIDYRDHEHYIDTTQTFSERQARIESAMQPSASSTTKDPKTQALRMEEAMLDIVGDENSDLVMKQRMMRWDKSKRKYIQTTLGQELRGGPGSSKKIMTESGKIVKVDKAKVGELYEKWQKKTQKSIGRSGVFDEDGQDAIDDKGSDQISKMQQRAAQQNKNSKESDKNFGLRSATEIRKEREEKQKLKIKNMEKGDRRRYEAKKNASHNTKKTKKGYQGKKGFSGNWGKKN